MRRPPLHLLLTVAACASTSQGQIAPTSAFPATEPPPLSTTSPPPDAPGTPPAKTAGGDAGTPPAAGTASPEKSLPSSAPIGAGDRGAEADFAVARTRFDAADHQGARATLEAFVARHPQHPSRLAAEILLARLALSRGDAAAARRYLEPIAASTAASGGAGVTGGASAGGSTGNETSARFYLGLAEVRLGNHARARALLVPFLPKGNTVTTEIAREDDAAIELRGALAEATAATDPIAALELWEAYARAAREHEKAWARGRASEISARLAPETAWRAYGTAPPASLTRAVLGAKAATHLRSRGDASGASFIDTETTAARNAMGFNVATAVVGPGDPTRIGLAIPLSGKFQVVGEAALRAAMLAAGTPVGTAATSGGPGGAGTQLLVRDTATDADRATRGVAELTRAEAAIAIIGAASSKTGNAAIAQATQDGIAMLALEDAPPGALTTAFQIVHAPEARAAALARQALKVGVRKFALFGPDSNAGKRLREAFRKTVTDGGGTIAVESTYVVGATSFSAAIGPLKKSAFEAIFVPDSAERLPLIAPALAVADLWPHPWNKPRPPAAAPSAKTGGGAGQAQGQGQRRSILLLSTANELTTKLVETAGRYVQGALLCPGFFADTADPRARGFVEAYRAAYGQEPHATEAYAYDAVAVLRAVTQRGARNRGDLVKALGLPGGAPLLQGLTGNVTFGPDHGRTDSPLVYVVDGDDIRAVK